LTGSSSHPVHHLCSTHTHTCSLSTLPFFPQYPDCQFAPAQQRPDLPGRLPRRTTHQGRPHGRCCVRALGRDARCRPALDSLLAFCPRPRRRRTYSLALKGGDPAAGSPTATLLRLRPSHQARLRPLRPLRVRSRTSGAPNFHGVTGGVYKARERIHRGVADPRLLAIPASCSRVADCNPNLDRVFPIRSTSRSRNGLSRPL
jgi:hypothetical protein